MGGGSVNLHRIKTIRFYSLFIPEFNYKTIKIKTATKKMINTLLWCNLKATNSISPKLFNVVFALELRNENTNDWMSNYGTVNII
jgi:hypothetical protein